MEAVEGVHLAAQVIAAAAEGGAGAFLRAQECAPAVVDRVDAQAGVQIAQQRRSRNAAGTRRGWDVGTLSSGDFGTDKLATVAAVC